MRLAVLAVAVACSSPPPPTGAIHARPGAAPSAMLADLQPSRVRALAGEGRTPVPIEPAGGMRGGVPAMMRADLDAPAHPSRPGPLPEPTEPVVPKPD